MPAVSQNKLIGRVAAFVLLSGLPALAVIVTSAGAAAPAPPPYPPVASEDWQPRAGDVILRSSDDLVGSRIRIASGESAIYSHVGVVVIRGAVPQVAEISPFGSGRVDFTDVTAFTTDGDAGDLLILRPRTPIDAGRLTAEAERLAAARIGFDYGFDMTDGSELYCAELANRLLGTAGFDVAGVPWTSMEVPLQGERNLVTPDAFAHTPTLRPVFRRRSPAAQPAA